MSEKDKTLKVAVVGCGSVSASFFNAPLSAENTKISGVTDLDKEIALSRTAEFGLDDGIVYESLDKLLEKAEPDIVFDCTIPSSHHEVTMKALEAGCHVLGVKPMTDSMEKAWEMVSTAQKNGLIYAVAQNYRHAPNNRAFAQLIREGSLGRLDTLAVNFFRGDHFGGLRETLDHPIMLEIAIHLYDLARFISGEEAVSVFCKEYGPKGGWYKKGNAAAVALFEMSGGSIFTFEGHWCANSQKSKTAPWDRIGTNFYGEWRAVGDRGTAFYDGIHCPVAQVLKPGKKSGGENEGNGMEDLEKSPASTTHPLL